MQNFYFYTFYFFRFYFFYFFGAGPSSAHMGAQPSPARSLAQASDRLGTVAGMRELFTHACNSNNVIILPLRNK